MVSSGGFVIRPHRVLAFNAKRTSKQCILRQKNNPLNPKIPRKKTNIPRKNTNIKNRGQWTNLSLPQCLLRKREIPLCGRFCGRCGQILPERKPLPPPSPFLRLAQDKKGEGALSKNRLTIPTYPPLTTGRELNTKANSAPLCPFG